jgi:hypothetical protein
MPFDYWGVWQQTPTILRLPATASDGAHEKAYEVPASENPQVHRNEKEDHSIGYA